ncbi:MAG: ABC transporter permease, partial [Mesorhizobium sp.]
MSALLAWLFTNPTVLAIGAAIIGALGFGFQQRLAGAKAERNRQEAD